MALLNLILIFLCSLAIRMLSRPVLRLDISEAARLIVLSYGLFLLFSLPWVWLEKWNPTHLTLLPGLTLLLLLPFLKKVRVEVAPQSLWISIAIAFALGAYLQKDSIYHVYATHDPSAYLNGSLNLTRTGSVFHTSPIQKLAHQPGNEILKELIETETPGRLPTNYGLVPKSPALGKSSYHGVFGAPLFLSLGSSLFGPKSFLRVQTLHLLASLILLTAILLSLIPSASRAIHLAPLFLAANPLVTLIFREPLSEPLAQVLFLGLAFSSLEMKREPAFARAGMMLMMGAALCTRISGILYFPFVFLLIALNAPTCKKERFVEGFCFLALLSFFATAFYTSGGYFFEILLFYTRVIHSEANAQQVVLLLAIVLGLGLTLFFFIRSHRDRFQIKDQWRRTFAFWFSLALIAGLVFRYGKVFLRLPQYFGGFPFVTFHLESLLFYSEPVLVTTGLFALWSYLRKQSSSRLLFLQGFFPFAMFFYFVFRFQPLNLQPNFQRYLIIELVPFCILGAVLLLSELFKQRRKILARSIVYFHFAWVLALLSLINHPQISKNALEKYEKAAVKINEEFFRPVIIASAPSWWTMTLLYPFSYGFGIPVLTAHRGMDLKEQQALSKLEELGFTPLIATDSTSKTVPVPNRWRQWAELEDCYEYPAFFLAAPPIDLDLTCYRIALHGEMSRGPNLP